MSARISIRAVLLVGFVAVLALPVGFAIAQVVQGQQYDESGEWLHRDPDPSTDPIVMGEHLREARATGNTAEEDRVLEEIHVEALSRLSPEERAAAESAPPAPDVPEGTQAYIPPYKPSVALLEDCEKRISEEKATPMCELSVLHAEGRIRSGAFSPEQIAEILGDDRATGDTR